MLRAAAATVLGLALLGGATAAAGTDPRNLTPPKLYGLFVAGRPVTVDPGRWSGTPHFQYYWQRCTPDISVCKPAPDLGDENATTVRPHGQPGYDVGNRIRVGITVNSGLSFVWAVSPVITVGGRPEVQTKGGIDPYTPPHVGVHLEPYFNWGGAPRSVSYRWQRCGIAKCVDIPGATRLSYRVTPADVGSRLRIVSTATAGGGTATASMTTKPVASR
jgi:hypothetical protein